MPFLEMEDAMADKAIMVSINMLTYQHVDYIRQAIDSILMQKVDFDYEIVIGDDSSTDGTKSILLEYKKKYPDKIKLFLNKKNVGAIRNSINVKKHCNGKYIAFLEGDDFWTDVNKLQIQIDFLENSPEYSGCYHDANVIGDNKKRCKLYKITRCDISGFKKYFDLIPTIPTASLVMINMLKDEENLKYFTKTKFIGDRIVHALILRQGKIKYIDKLMCTYRFITNGKTSYSSMNYILKLKDYINAVKVQREIAPQDYYEIITKHIIKCQCDLINKYIKEHFYKELLCYWLKNLSTKEKGNIIIYKLKSKSE